MALAYRWTHPSPMTIYVHLFNKSIIHYHSDIAYHMTLNTMFGVVAKKLIKFEEFKYSDFSDTLYAHWFSKINQQMNQSIDLIRIPPMSIYFTMTKQRCHTSWVFILTPRRGANYITLSHVCLSRKFYYALNFVISTSLMSLFVLYAKTLRNGCSQIIYHFLLSCFPPIYIMSFDITLNHHGIKPHTHTLHVVIIVITAMVSLCYSIISHAALILFYFTFMLRVHNSSNSRALWLLQTWYYKV